MKPRTPEQADYLPSPAPPPESQHGALKDGVIGHVARYAMPNISSMLPNYSNADAEFIFRTFNTGNYDLLKTLPDTIREQEVGWQALGCDAHIAAALIPRVLPSARLPNPLRAASPPPKVQAARTARMEITRKFLMPALGQPLLRSRPDNQQNLFSVFEYIPSRLSLADELASKQRVESEAKRMAVSQPRCPTNSCHLPCPHSPPHSSRPSSRAIRLPAPQIGGKEFIPTGHVELPKHKDLSGAPYPHMGGGGATVEDHVLAQSWIGQQDKVTGKPWVPSDKVGDRPTRQMARVMMDDIRKWIHKVRLGREEEG